MAKSCIVKTILMHFKTTIAKLYIKTKHKRETGAK